MTIKIGINGFGRIGRLLTRAIFLRKELDMELVAINDPSEIKTMQYLLTYDSVHRKWNADISIEKDFLVINKKYIKISHERNPENIDWVNADYILESSGCFTKMESAKKHLSNNKKIKGICVSAPSDDIPMYVMGVNNKDYKDEKIISNASCTTNCLAPVAKILHENYGIVEGLMTTIHATTATQKTVDGLSTKDWRGGRSILNNIIPSSTGAAKAVGKIIPELEGKLTGMAIRVPVSNGSLVDLTVKLDKKTDLQEIEKTFTKNSLNGIITIAKDEIVSSDIIGNSSSSIFDKNSSVMLNENFFKLIFWYDNEWGYSNRLLELVLNCDRTSYGNFR